MNSVSSRWKIKQGGGWGYLGVVSATGSINELRIYMIRLGTKNIACMSCDIISNVYSRVKKNIAA